MASPTTQQTKKPDQTSSETSNEKTVDKKFENLKVLAVVAHPDDEAYFSGTIYRLTEHFNGKADMVVITNGEGGYKYSDLAEKFYGLNLSDETIGRANLPKIREQELKAGGKIIGINNYDLLLEKDDQFTTDENTIMKTSLWGIDRIQKVLKEKLERGNYDIVLTILPDKEEHAAHKSATLLALEAVNQLPEGQRPIVLGADLAENITDKRVDYTPPEGFDVAKLETADPEIFFNRLTSFGPKNNLNYKIITNWHIAEHKTQGASQAWVMKMNSEQFRVFSVTPDEKLNFTSELFTELNLPPRPEMLVPKILR